MRQAITTKYIGPTNHRGARVKASCQSGSIMVPWDHALNSEENHRAAMWELAKTFRYQEGGEWVGGGVSSGYVFVFVEK